MKALQIAIGFDFSSLYKNLFQEMIDQGIELEVHVPRKKSDELTEIDRSEFNYKINVSNQITRMNQLLYFPRIKKAANIIQQEHDLKSFDISHAHSLLSDGGVAYELYKKYKIPYIVAVRDTDINKYFKYAKHLLPVARRILDNAQNVIFLSKAYKELMYSTYFTKDNDELIQKSIVIPNGIDEFWHQNRVYADKQLKDAEINLFFVGKLTERKNPEMVIQVQRKLEELGHDTKVSFVGTGDLEEKLKEMTKDEPNIHFHGQISEKQELWDLYKDKDSLLVPSFTETFGLVYAEAMSTGTPVLYTRKQGFDGIFAEGEVGYSVNPNDLDEIVSKVLEVKKNNQMLSKNALEGSKQFNWHDIVNEYSQLYATVEK